MIFSSWPQHRAGGAFFSPLARMEANGIMIEVEAVREARRPKRLRYDHCFRGEPRWLTY